MSTVLVCADDPSPAVTLEVPEANVVAVDNLCTSPKQIATKVPEGEALLVLAVHREVADRGAIQSAARQLGFDPLSVGIVDLSATTGAAQASLACEANLARISRFPGSVPQQVKLVPNQRKTRKAFLSLGAPVYVGAPMIDGPSCVADQGCKLCVTECPTDALSSTGGAVAYDVTKCVACGICVTTCPTGAIENPSVDPGAVEAEIQTAVNRSPDPLGIRFRCRDSVVAAESGWYQVEVPCTGMLTVGWAFAPLLLGAAHVDAVPCGAGGCGLGNDERLEKTMRDVATAVETISTDASDLARSASASVHQGWLNHGSTGRVLSQVTGAHAVLSMTFDTADVGMINIDPSTCTACEMCAQICPTDALRSAPNVTGVRISFDPQICVGCGQCVATCPELEHGAIELKRGFDVSEWAAARREVRYEPTAACEICGEPVAPAAMLSRIKEMLGEEATETMALVSRRCINCRGR